MRFVYRLLRGAENRQAMARFSAGVDKIVEKLPGSDDGLDCHVDFSAMSTWSIVCEEMVDTSYSHAFYQRAFQELHRRGISDKGIEDMRRFAWLTAGWVNYEKMLWDWVHLDEKDIIWAINWQYSDGWISWAEKRRKLAYLRRYLGHV